MQRSIYSGGGGSAGVDRLRKDSCSEMIYKSHRISLSTGRSGVGESGKMFAQSCCWFNKIPRFVHIGIYFSCQRGGVGVDPLSLSQMNVLGVFPLTCLHFINSKSPALLEACSYSTRLELVSDERKRKSRLSPSSVSNLNSEFCLGPTKGLIHQLWCFLPLRTFDTFCCCILLSDGVYFYACGDRSVVTADRLASPRILTRELEAESAEAALGQCSALAGD
ncbi:hypothetical protein GOODEAATRI_005592 [Goodea atripinnis]|uniref:Uncharacterized protein n=1 Tax=Goodea atripinnis TaxID=208336 RepID=A0ABV0PBM3_9TELE